MKINKKIVSLVFLSLLALSNIILLFKVNPINLGNLVTLITFLVVPGVLLMLILEIRKMFFWNFLSFTIGLSLLFLLGGGLLINFLLPLINIKQPLSLVPSLLSFDVFILSLIIFMCISSKNFIFNISIHPVRYNNLIYYFIPLLFLIYSIFGAFSLNNGGSNIFTIILYLLVGFYVFLLVFLNKRISYSIFPYTIFFISISLLLTTSLRGWFITGHDIQIEYYVFALTKQHNLWNMDYFKNAYNSCLSITLLPTLFSNFLQINNIYIYKIIYQILFSLVPVSSFLLFNKFASRRISLISSFHLMLFPTYVNDMSMMNRQEIAFIFFSLMLLILFSDEVKFTTKKFLFILFGIGMIFSHYSTTYVSVGLLGLGFISSLLMRKNFLMQKFQLFTAKLKINITTPIIYEKVLNIQIILIIAFISFFWVIFTNIGGDIYGSASKIITNIRIPVKTENQSVDVRYSIFNWNKPNDAIEFNSYLNSANENAFKKYDGVNIYDPKTSTKYQINNLQEEILPLTFIGDILNRAHINIYLSLDTLRQSYAKFIQLFILIGVITLIFYSKKTFQVHSDYLALCIAAILTLALFVLLPSVSADYGIFRAFQQMLLILALPATIGCITIFKLLYKRLAIYLTSLFFIFYFLILIGVFQQITGGYNGELRLNNTGLYYDVYYTHLQEIKSMSWLIKNKNKNSDIQSDLFANSKFMANYGLFTNIGILPSMIYKNDYVYLDYFNTTESKDVVFYMGDLLIYKYPINFLNDNKNLVYNNGQTRIYK